LPHAWKPVSRRPSTLPILVQGVLGDPAALRVGVAATEVVDMPVETSLQLLQQQALERTAIDSDPRAAQIPHHSAEPGGR